MHSATWPPAKLCCHDACRQVAGAVHLVGSWFDLLLVNEFASLQVSICMLESGCQGMTDDEMALTCDKQICGFSFPACVPIQRGRIKTPPAQVKWELHI